MDPHFLVSLVIRIRLILIIFFHVLSNFVPISLLVTLEMVKFFQGTFMENDLEIFDAD